MSLQLKLGADPEVFLSLGGQFISAHGLFPGTKNEPHKVEKGAVQVDGLALEYNIDPATTAEEFSNNHEVVLRQMKEMIARVDKDMKINFTPIAKFDVKYFAGLPDNAKVLGCDPDFSSITGGVIVKSADITNVPIRTAAGHVHVGWTEGEDPMSPAHFADAQFISQTFFSDYNSQFRPRTPQEEERLRYYGGYGAFRPKSYGVELRQFSNLWVEDSNTRHQMFNYVTKKITQLYKGN